MPRNGIIVSGGSDSKESACNAGNLGSILGQEHPLEKEMAAHSSIFSWRIPRTEEPSGSYSPWGCKKSDTIEQLKLMLILLLVF